MTMLSSVAERLYWMARYLERAEDTARLVSAYNHLIMDIPSGSEPGWDIMVKILDAQEQFAQRFRVANEQNVLKLLLADEESPCSIPYSVKAARENVRTTRDVLPEDAWELMNELHIFTRDNAEKSVGRRNRHAFLAEFVSRCQTLNGLIQTTLSRDHAYRFIKLGQLLERADMTTRVVDVGAGDILDREGNFAAIDPLLWSSLLNALSAMSAYRRQVGPLIEKNAMVDFVFMEPAFPRSVRFCIRGIREELGPLKNNGATLRSIERIRRRLRRFHAEQVSRAELHAFIDEFQHQVNLLHRSIDATWFQPEA